MIVSQRQIACDNYEIMGLSMCLVRFWKRNKKGSQCTMLHIAKIVIESKTVGMALACKRDPKSLPNSLVLQEWRPIMQSAKHEKRE